MRSTYNTVPVEPAHGGTMNFTQIGYEIGFGGLRNFETHFKELTGQTPYQYRKRVVKRRAISFAKSTISFAKRAI